MRYFIGMLLVVLYALACAEVAPNLTLAKEYQQGMDVSAYWISEKYDGVRGYWNGKQLLSRQGKAINAPQEFLQQLPNFSVEGELWFGRGQFSRASALVHRAESHPDYLTEWQQVHYILFDAPFSSGNFKERYAKLKTLEVMKLPNIKIAEQQPATNHQDLMQQLNEVTIAGGEGLMLRRVAATYKGGRSDDLLKLKIRQDADAIVLEHLLGKGKYQGMLGALVVQLENSDIQFRIGTGFSDAERANPPAIGARISFYYQGFTANGLPRFPVYWRLREDQ